MLDWTREGAETLMTMVVTQSVASRVCRTCGERKAMEEFPSRAAQRCSRCVEERTPLEAAKKAARYCPTCKRRRPLGMFRGALARQCEECRSVPTRPCWRCLEHVPVPELPPVRSRTRGVVTKRKSRVCLPCLHDEALEMNARQDARLAQRATWTDDDGVLVRRCYKCRKVWPLTEGFYLHTPSAKTAERGRGYLCKRCSAVREVDYERWARRHPELGDVVRARDAERSRRYRQTHPETVRAQRARRRERIKADGERYARQLESARLRYRLQAMREGREVAYRGKPPGPRPTTGVAPYTPEQETYLLPAEPLAAACDAVIFRRKALGHEDVLEWLFRPMTHDAAQRALFAWRTGERERVNFETASTVLLNAGLHYWDVWNEDTVRMWEFRFVRKRMISGRWARTRGWHAGRDFGPDLEELERVRFAFEGAPEEMAA